MNPPKFFGDKMSGKKVGTSKYYYARAGGSDGGSVVLMYISKTEIELTALKNTL